MLLTVSLKVHCPLFCFAFCPYVYVNIQSCIISKCVSDLQNITLSIEFVVVFCGFHQSAKPFSKSVSNCTPSDVSCYWCFRLMSSKFNNFLYNACKVHNFAMMHVPVLCISRVWPHTFRMSLPSVCAIAFALYTRAIRFLSLPGLTYFHALYWLPNMCCKL